MRVVLDKALLLILGLLAAGAPPLAAADGDPVADSSSSINLAPFHQRIRTIERESGALDYRLAEHFLSLGLAYRANGDLDDAVNALEFSGHSVRCP